MSKKVSERSIAILVGIVGVVIIGLAIYFTSSMAKSAPGKDQPGGNVLGPETVQNTPATTTGVQTAMNTPVTPQSDPPGKDEPTPPIVFNAEYMTFKAELPAGAPNDPVLAYLKKDTEDYLAKKKADAEASWKVAKAKKLPAQPWDFEVKWKWTARAGDMVSLAGIASEYEGGAHPLQLYDTLIARTSAAKVKFDDMFVADKSPSPAVQIGICEALKKAKQEQIKAATIFDEPIVCAGPNANAKTEKAVIALAPSSEAGKFGGIYAYYNPYEVGPYSEGSYKVVVQQSVFAADLKPEFKALFGGVAPPGGDRL